VQRRGIAEQVKLNFQCVVQRIFMSSPKMEMSRLELLLLFR